MASLIALRAILGASIGLGSLDLVWLNLTLAPALVAPASAGATVMRDPLTPSAERQVPALDEEPASPAPRVPRGGRVYFAPTSATLDGATRATLASLAAQAGARAAIVLEGHADAQGDAAFNRDLSKQRAEAVGAHLERLGIARSRIRVGFVGEASALEHELWRDRRVELQIIGGP